MEHSHAPGSGPARIQAQTIGTPVSGSPASPLRAGIPAGWRRHAQRTARRFNLAWWLQFFAPWAAGLGLAVLGLVLFLRSRGTPLPAAGTAVALTGIYLAAATACWLAARRRFVRERESLVLLESRLRLDNALSAAAEGITHWPEAPAAVDDGFRFRAPWLVAPALLALTCLLLAFLLPVSRAEAPPALPPPQALSRVEELLNTLKKEDAADPQALERARQQMEALLNQPQQEYYSHHSLEAADNLETSLREAAGQMGAQLQTAVQAAESLQKYEATLSPSARQQLESGMNTAVEGLKHSSLGLSGSMKEQLSQLDPSKLKEFDPSQLEKMLQNLKEKAAACRECQGGEGGEGMSAAEKALNDLLNGGSGKRQGQNPAGEGGEGEGQSGEQEETGRGGVQRGPGTKPLSFEKNASELGTSNLEQLESQDLSRTLPGDHLGTRDMEHRLDKTSAGPADGGATAAPAGGGDAVSRTQLMPSEQKVLQRYFK